MNNKEFNQFLPNKFLVMLGNLYGLMTASTEKQIKKMGFNGTELMILYAVAVNGKMSIQDIAATIFSTPSNMTYNIDKLVKKELVERITSEADKRSFQVKLTEEGEITWQRIKGELVIILDDMFKDIDNDMLSETISNMKQISKSIRKSQLERCD